jgi:hypothetical protein
MAHFEAVWLHAMDFDRPYVENDLENWERELEQSGQLSDRIYKLRLYQLRSNYPQELNEVQDDYEKNLEMLKTSWRQQQDGRGHTTVS